MIYKLCKDFISKQIVSVIRKDNDEKISGIPFDSANTDYQQFKTDIANGVELHDADDNVMTEEQKTAFVASLP